MLSFEGIKPVSTKPYPFTKKQKEWLAALRSEKYKQGQGVLCNASKEYCCLGVICELEGINKILEDGVYSYIDEDSAHTNRSYLPNRLRDTYHLKGTLGEFPNPVAFSGIKAAWGSLAGMNDNRLIETGKNLPKRSFTFTEIADYIEYDPWNVFNEPGGQCAQVSASA